MWVNILIGLLSSQLTKDVVALLLDKIAESVQNNATKEQTDKLKESL